MIDLHGTQSVAYEPQSDNISTYTIDVPCPTKQMVADEHIVAQVLPIRLFQQLSSRRKKQSDRVIPIAKQLVENPTITNIPSTVGGIFQVHTEAHECRQILCALC